MTDSGHDNNRIIIPVNIIFPIHRVCALWFRETLRRIFSFSMPTSSSLIRYIQGRTKKPGPLCFTACNFRNIDKIFIKLGIKVILFLTLIHNLFGSTLENMEYGAIQPDGTVPKI